MLLRTCDGTDRINILTVQSNEIGVFALCAFPRFQNARENKNRMLYSNVSEFVCTSISLCVCMSAINVYIQYKQFRTTTATNHLLWFELNSLLTLFICARTLTLTKDNGDHFRMWWENNFNSKTEQTLTHTMMCAGESDCVWVCFLCFYLRLRFVFHSPIVGSSFSFCFCFSLLPLFWLQNHNKKERHIANRLIARTKKNACETKCAGIIAHSIHFI